jgi:hypothetical protein
MYVCVYVSRRAFSVDPCPRHLRSPSRAAAPTSKLDAKFECAVGACLGSLAPFHPKVCNGNGRVTCTDTGHAARYMGQVTCTQVPCHTTPPPPPPPPPPMRLFPMPQPMPPMSIPLVPPFRCCLCLCLYSLPTRQLWTGSHVAMDLDLKLVPSPALLVTCLACPVTPVALAVPGPSSAPQASPRVECPSV